MKNNKTINIPLEWRHNYFLKGFVIHSGGPGGGHYISVAQVNNKWYLFDDTRKNEIEKDQVDHVLKLAIMCLHFVLSKSKLMLMLLTFCTIKM